MQPSLQYGKLQKVNKTNGPLRKQRAMMLFEIRWFRP